MSFSFNCFTFRIAPVFAVGISVEKTDVEGAFKEIIRGMISVQNGVKLN